MKVIKGPMPPQKIFHVVCKYCKAEFHAIKEDLHFTSDRDGPYFVLKCTFCEDDTYYAVQALERRIVSSK